MAQSDWPVTEFKAALDRILRETRLTQGGLAALVPMDQSQLSRWKSGASRPKYENLAALADAVEREYPDVSISKREILSAAGYGATLAPAKVAAEATPPAEVASGHGEEVRRLYEASLLTLEDLQSPEYVALEAEFFATVERGEEPGEPPAGIKNSNERIVWAMSPPPHWRYAAIRALREEAAKDAEEDAAWSRRHDQRQTLGDDWRHRRRA